MILKHAIKLPRIVFMRQVSIKTILQTNPILEGHTDVKGWVRGVREHRDVVFLNISDGSSLRHLQVVTVPAKFPSAATYGSCIQVQGRLKPSLHPEQPVEIHADSITILGGCDHKEFPYKHRKTHAVDYVRQYPHLRPRTTHFSSLLRIRNAAAQAFHAFFQDKGYINIHTPILTSNDCEGAGETFQVEPADKGISERTGDVGVEDNRQHFFNTPTFLTVSGQLHLEVMTGAFSKAYTFGPTFRAESSGGRHHLSEFYMLEAEQAFTRSLDELMQVIEALMKTVTRSVLDCTSEDVQYLWKNAATVNQKVQVETWLSKSFIKLPYKEAIELLQKDRHHFQMPVKWGSDLQKEHERHLVSICGNIPVFVTDFPSKIKPFYARVCEEDTNIVSAVDLLVPDVGEVCGGSLREERLEVLEDKIKCIGQSHSLQWYVDLRRFGSAPHGGFGLGFERYLQTLLGIANIKDTIPFPRYPHNCKL